MSINMHYTENFSFKDLVMITNKFSFFGKKLFENFFKLNFQECKMQIFNKQINHSIYCKKQIYHFTLFKNYLFKNNFLDKFKIFFKP